jgi:hypothetical protein
MNTTTNCSSGGWKLLYRGETEISSTIASLSEKLQLKVAPFLLPCYLFALALNPLQGDPMPIHKPCVVGGYAVSLVFRLMPSQDCSWVACSLCGMCVSSLPNSAPFCNIHPCTMQLESKPFSQNSLKSLAKAVPFRFSWFLRL